MAYDVTTNNLENLIRMALRTAAENMEINPDRKNMVLNNILNQAGINDIEPKKRE